MDSPLCAIGSRKLSTASKGFIAKGVFLPV